MYCATNKHADWFREGLPKHSVGGNVNILWGLKFETLNLFIYLIVMGNILLETKLVSGSGS